MIHSVFCFRLEKKLKLSLFQSFRLIEWNTTEFFGTRNIPKTENFVTHFALLMMANGVIVGCYLLYGSRRSMCEFNGETVTLIPFSA